MNEEDIENGLVIVPLENRMCPPYLEERDVFGFGTFLGSTYHACWQEGGSTVRCEKTDSRCDMPD